MVTNVPAVSSRRYKTIIWIAEIQLQSIFISHKTRVAQIQLFYGFRIRAHVFVQYCFLKWISRFPRFVVSTNFAFRARFHIHVWISHPCTFVIPHHWACRPEDAQASLLEASFAAVRQPDPARVRLRRSPRSVRSLWSPRLGPASL